ncbi:hypothetical protein F5X99DRAFT_425222 [Biscogniauxia marginata]|nr:hypothetical protein F5X99DRAFT_425222 [Biscogniauxia marginata]
MSQTPAGSDNDPIWARTSVLCNGQIAYKVKNKNELEPRQDPKDPRYNYKPGRDAADNLFSLNSLQISRKHALSGLEVARPLSHAWGCLPLPVQNRIWLGADFGWEGDIFKCPDNDFNNRMGAKFGKRTRANGKVIYSKFFQQVRSAEYLLWPVEVDDGHWMAVLAHLRKRNVPNPAKPANLGNDAIPDTIPSKDYNSILRWGVVTARRDPPAQALKNRVRQRFAEIVKQGDLTLSNNLETELWVPEDTDNFSSGLRVYNLIKEQMHRVTEFYCREIPHQGSFWDPHRGWLDVDEVRSEMQGRAAQNCLNDLAYYARIAIEGVRPEIGIKNKVKAHKLRPKNKNKRAYIPGQVSGGHCVESGGYKAPDNENDPDNDPEKGPEKGPENPPQSPPGGNPPQNPPENLLSNNEGTGSSGTAPKGSGSTGNGSSGKHPSGNGTNSGGSSGGGPKDLSSNPKGKMKSKKPESGNPNSPDKGSDVNVEQPYTEPEDNNGSQDSETSSSSDDTDGGSNAGEGNGTDGGNNSNNGASGAGAPNSTGEQVAESSAQAAPSSPKKKKLIDAEDDVEWDNGNPKKKIRPRRFREATFLKTQEDIDEARAQLEALFAAELGTK